MSDKTPEKIWAVQQTNNTIIGPGGVFMCYEPDTCLPNSEYTRSDLIAEVTAERDRLREVLENVLNARASKCPDVKLHNKICEDAWELLDRPRKALEGREEG